MPLNAKVGSFNTGTAAAGNQVQVTGVGFQPKAIIFWWSGNTGIIDAVAGGNIQRGIGMATGPTERYAAANMSDDGAGVSNVASHSLEDGCIYTITTADAVDGIMDFVSFDADGFTLEIDDAFSASLRVHYLAIGGDEISNAKVLCPTISAGSGSKDITGFGFQPDFTFLARSAVPGGVIQNIGLLVCGAANASNQAMWGGSGIDNFTDTDTSNYCRNGELLATVQTGSVSARMQFTSFIADGIRVNVTEGSGGSLTKPGILALKGGRYAVGSLATRTDGNDIVVTGLGFEPEAIAFFSHSNSESALDTVQAEDRFSMGAATGPAERAAIATLDQDALATSKCTRAVEHDAVYARISAAEAIDALMDLKSVEEDGFTCVMDDPDSAANFVWFFAMGSPGGAVQGALNAVSGLAGSFKRTRHLAGAMTSVSAIGTTQLKVTRQIGGEANAISQMLGNFSIPGVADLDGVLPALSTFSGSIKVNKVLEGGSNSVSVLSGSLKRAINLSGSLVAVSAFTASFESEPGTITTFGVIKPKPIELEAIYG